MVEKIYRLKVKNGETEIEIEGDKAFVKHYFSEVSSFISTGRKIKIKAMGRPPVKGKRGRKRGRRAKGKSSKKAPKPKKEKIDLKQLPLEKILELAKSKKESDRILFMAYIVNKINRKREFRSKDIINLYKEYEIQPPKRMDYYLRRLGGEENGYLAYGRRKGRYKISDTGLKHLSENP